MDAKRANRLQHFQSHRWTALITASALLALAVVAGVAYGYLHAQFWYPQDPEATVRLLQENRDALWLEVFLWWGIVVLDVVIAVGLFQFYRALAPGWSWAMLLGRLGYTAILVWAVVELTQALGGHQPWVALQRFDLIWAGALIVFGIHLVLLGILALRTSVTPPLLSWLVGLGGLCYVLVHGFKVIGHPWTSSLEAYLAVPKALSELILAGWLLVVGVRASRRGATAV